MENKIFFESHTSASLFLENPFLIENYNKFRILNDQEGSSIPPLWIRRWHASG